LGTVYQSKSKQKREKFSINSKGKGWILARGKTGKKLQNRPNMGKIWKTEKTKGPIRTWVVIWWVFSR